MAHKGFDRDFKREVDQGKWEQLTVSPTCPIAMSLSVIRTESAEIHAAIGSRVLVIRMALFNG
jgi:hypothetical protein